MSKLPKPTLPLGSDFGPYRLVDLIAVGGMAEVYLASTRGVAGFEKHLALKVIHPDYADDARFVQMLVDEAKLAVQLNHPNITQTFDLGRIGDVYFISMEYVDGADYFRVLKGVTDRDADIPVAAALFVAKEVCSGLHYAHTKVDSAGEPLRIIHRDVSPQNVLVSRQGEVKLVDFGIAKAANASTRTRAGVIKGKLVYMSPEQAWGDAVDERSDVFSAGIVLYEALTGGSLYMEQNPAKLIEIVRRADIDPPSSIREELGRDIDGLVMGALARDPDQRPQSAQAFGHLISEMLRTIAPDYAPARLGALIEAVVDEKALPSASGTVDGGASTVDRSAMDRADFVVQAHSVIFSASDIVDQSSSELSANVAAAAPAIARLLLTSQDGARSFEVGEQFVIGRSGDMGLADARVSRRHARVLLHENAYLLEDLGSANGTFLNEQRVDSVRRLRPGDTIRVGPFELRFVLEEPAPEKPVPPPPVADSAQTDDREGTDTYVRSSSGPPQSPRESQPANSVAASPPPAVSVAVRLGEEELRVSAGGQLIVKHELMLDTVSVPVGGACLRWDGGEYRLEAIDAMPQPRCNGSLTKNSTAVHSGDVLSLGSIEIEFLGED